MKKEAVKDIQEIIEFLLRTREQQFRENEENAYLINSFPENNYDLEKENKETLQRFDERLITLNSLLKKEQQNSNVLDIEAQMRKIQVKKIISVKEYTEIYGDSSTSQKNDRGLVNNPLPYNQKVKDGKITYNVDEVEEWRAQNSYKMAGKRTKRR